jgi:hypothetical protein
MVMVLLSADMLRLTHKIHDAVTPLPKKACDMTATTSQYAVTYLQAVMLIASSMPPTTGALRAAGSEKPPDHSIRYEPAEYPAKEADNGGERRDEAGLQATRAALPSASPDPRAWCVVTLSHDEREIRHMGRGGVPERHLFFNTKKRRG